MADLTISGKLAQQIYEIARREQREPLGFEVSSARAIMLFA